MGRFAVDLGDTQQTCRHMGSTRRGQQCAPHAVCESQTLDSAQMSINSGWVTKLLAVSTKRTGQTDPSCGHQHSKAWRKRSWTRNQIHTLRLPLCKVQGKEEDQTRALGDARFGGENMQKSKLCLIKKSGQCFCEGGGWGGWGVGGKVLVTPASTLGGTLSRIILFVSCVVPVFNPTM